MRLLHNSKSLPYPSDPLSKVLPPKNSIKINSRLAVPALILLLSGYFLFLGGMPSPARALTYPDPKSFQGLKEIKVEVISFEDMTEVNLHPKDVKLYVEERLQKAGIRVIRENPKALGTSPQKESAPGQPMFGLIGVEFKRSETSMSLGGNLNSFLISVKLFQPVEIIHNRLQTYGITWLKSRSIVAGSKRPKMILEGLDVLVDEFIKDFLKANPT